MFKAFRGSFKVLLKVLGMYPEALQLVQLRSNPVDLRRSGSCLRSKAAADPHGNSEERSRTHAEYVLIYSIFDHIFNI